MRNPRISAVGVVVHVISRFVDRDWIFRAADERARYLKLLGDALVTSDWRCLAYALMSSHIHLALVGGITRMESWIKRVHSPFANWMNEKYGRLGPIFADRPAQWLIRPQSEPDLIAYIHNNPVRAGVVSRARESRWTSHRAYLGLTRVPPWLCVEEGLIRSWQDAASFDTWVDGNQTTVEHQRLEGIYKLARRRGAIELGTPTSKPIEVALVSRAFARIRPDPSLVLDMVANVVGIRPDEFTSRNPRPDLVAARRVVVHSGKALGLNGSELADVLGVSRKTTSRLGLTPLSESEQTVVRLVVARLEMRGTNGTPSPTQSRRFAHLDEG
jgi:hypothetical protein